MTTEGLIKKSIMDWLNLQPGCYTRVIQIAGFRGRANVSKGVFDILGAWRGRALAIEVKTEKGKLSPEQRAFLHFWVERGGGIGIVARSLQDVIDVLKREEKR